MIFQIKNGKSVFSTFTVFYYCFVAVSIISQADFK